jgi:phosphotransferase system HPr-like phosphotransfer protein
MMLAAGQGSKLVFRADGAPVDAQRMLADLGHLFDSRFEEV